MPPMSNRISEMPEAAVGGLGAGALGPISPSMTTASLYFSP